MFRMTIELEAVRPPLSSVDPTEIKVEVYVATRKDADRALARILELAGVPTAPGGVAGMGSVQDGTLT